MNTATLTSKGQLVIPKAVRAALHLRAGTQFSVTLDGGRIVLEPSASKTKRLSDWLPALQVRRKVKARELIAPVDGYTGE
jgi:AbrB family looped-hinge helix DNA binding protein